MSWWPLVVLGCALLPAVMYARNIKLFAPPPKPTGPLPPISVLIPARNEEASIAAAVESVLASHGVELECIVLDDSSTDLTAGIVRQIATTDARLRLETAPPLPSGWSGKQHACHTLATLARHPLLTFIDADVRLHPDGLCRMTGFQIQSGANLVSGFPRQETGTLLEKLVIPLIHFLLLGFLPFDQMRRLRLPALGAGCGQWFLTTREAYFAVGGHSHPLVKSSFHDGVKLPRAYRTAGRTTDLCDVTGLATCRMYRSAGQVWHGLAKNAREGLATPVGILFWTAVLTLGQIVPFVLLGWAVYALTQCDFSRTRFDGRGGIETSGDVFQAVADLLLAAPLCAFGWYVRLSAARRFRQSWLGAVLHPVGILALLGIQWYAILRAAVGRPVGWKGRPNPASNQEQA